MIFIAPFCGNSVEEGCLIKAHAGTGKVRKIGYLCSIELFEIRFNYTAFFYVYHLRRHTNCCKPMEVFFYIGHRTHMTEIKFK